MKCELRIFLILFLTITICSCAKKINLSNYIANHNNQKLEYIINKSIHFKRDIIYLGNSRWNFSDTYAIPDEASTSLINYNIFKNAFGDIIFEKKNEKNIFLSNQKWTEGEHNMICNIVDSRYRLIFGSNRKTIKVKCESFKEYIDNKLKYVTEKIFIKDLGLYSSESYFIDVNNVRTLVNDIKLISRSEDRWGQSI